jgi:signal transduction histidine kinase/CHASE2 domain-containing sensor protein
MKWLGTNRQAGPISLWRWLRLNAVLLGLVLLVSLSFPVATLNKKLSDMFFFMRPAQSESQHVAMVFIDDASLARYGRWPWQRERLAQLINAVSQQKPAAIGLDVLLPEAEDERNDAALESAIRSAKNVVLATKISSSPDSRMWIDPLPRFAGAAIATGHVQAILDDDGLCRSIPLEEPAAEGLRPAFALKIASFVRPELAKLEPGASVGEGIERLESHPLIINFRRQFSPAEEHTPFTVASAADLLSNHPAPELTGKAVLIGFGSVEMSDRLFTPVSVQLPMPGVEINANVLDSLLSGVVITRAAIGWQLLLVIFISALSLWLVVRYPGVRSLAMLLGLLAAGYGCTFFLFERVHVLLLYGPVIVAIVLAAPLAQLENLLIIDREVTVRLQQLHQAISPASQSAISLKGKSSRLHWKLGALSELQAELTSLYAFQQTLLETMREGLAVYREDGKLSFGNAPWKTFCAKQNATPDTLQGITQLSTAWPELAVVAQTGGTWVETELPLGEELWHLYAVPLPWTSFAQDGAVMLIAEDITARRQRDQARSEALSFVTHELRTPLIAIQGFSEMLMRYPNQAAGSDAPATIFRESNRLVAMINTYLEVLRLDSGARPLKMARASVRTMTEHVEKVVRPLAAAARMTVRTEIHADDEFITCDETLIAGALLNLVSNAIKYGTAGTEVMMRLTSHEQEMEFEVNNAGPTIPASELKNLFERFYRPSRSEAIPGWGLGLNFVRRICQQHGGRVEVSSDEKTGTSFVFTLPRGVREVSEVAQ